MKLALIALLILAPVFAATDWWDRADAARARAEASREMYQARREVRRATAGAAREVRQARAEARRETRSLRYHRWY